MNSLFALNPVSRPRDSSTVVRRLTREENSCRDTPCRPRYFERYRFDAAVWPGNINPVPFRLRGTLKGPPVLPDLPTGLGPAYPWTIAVPKEPFLTSDHKDLACVIATTTKICTGRGFPGHQ